MQFQFVSQSSPTDENARRSRLAAFDQLLTDDLADFFDKCHWSIKHRRTFFANDGAKLVQLIAAQLGTYIVPTLAYRLNSVEQVDDETVKCKIVLGSIQRFFQLVCFALSELAQESNRNKLPDRVVAGLRQLISSIGQHLLTESLLRHLKRLSDHLFNFGRIRHFQISLLDSVDKFEKVLRTANQYFKNNNDIYIIDPSAIKQLRLAIDHWIQSFTLKSAS